MIDPTFALLSIVKQCELVDIHRSGLYYQPRKTSSLNLTLMDHMDRHYLDHPYKGARRMHIYLTKDLGYEVSLNRVQRLYYEVMGLKAVFPGPHTSKRNKAHKIYPYLLRELEISYPNQVWATDITYIGLPIGYMYLIAIIDLYSRFVLNWSLSNTMDAQWCTDCFLQAIEIHGKPLIINTDQGAQFTSEVFSKTVLNNQVRLSMDGKGRATDNAFIECLWKLVKYEDVYIKVYDSALKLYHGLDHYFHQYNTNRRHSSIGDNYPCEVYHNMVSLTA